MLFHYSLFSYFYSLIYSVLSNIINDYNTVIRQCSREVQCCAVPPGSGSVSQRCRSGSASIIKQKKVRKTLISAVLWHLYDFLSLKNDVNVASKQKNSSTFRYSSQWEKLPKVTGNIVYQVCCEVIHPINLTTKRMSHKYRYWVVRPRLCNT
jgi:hypothetical protein